MGPLSNGERDWEGGGRDGMERNVREERDREGR